jgi:hypothetical protein
MAYLPLEATDLDSYTKDKGKTVVSGTLRKSLGISPLDKYPTY